MTHYLEYSE